MTKKELQKLLNDTRESVYSQALEKLNEESEVFEKRLVESLKAGKMTLDEVTRAWNIQQAEYLEQYKILKKACKIK